MWSLGKLYRGPSVTTAAAATVVAPPAAPAAPFSLYPPPPPGPPPAFSLAAFHSVRFLGATPSGVGPLATTTGVAYRRRRRRSTAIPSRLAGSLSLSTTHLPRRSFPASPPSPTPRRRGGHPPPPGDVSASPASPSSPPVSALLSFSVSILSRPSFFPPTFHPRACVLFSDDRRVVNFVLQLPARRNFDSIHRHARLFLFTRRPRLRFKFMIF
ncbi:hypothetical protein PUN28_014451 [Cardiocondyla obscurior]|uniref:Uncharacterized protein n=1 Tax=Cardiocondyla obscurior TaxID=286306 RepID=A0AAW2F3W0_9HYME